MIKLVSAVYVCGPRRLIDGVREVVERLEMGEDEVHFEAFQGKLSLCFVERSLWLS